MIKILFVPLHYQIKNEEVMKTNEAPEKIYLFENPISETPDDRWLSKKSCDEDVEYTRTDAFIEKALDWIDYNNRNGGCNFDGWGEDFKNYMRGE